MRPVIVGLCLFVSLLQSFGQTKPQNEDDAWREMLRRAYELLEKYRADYNKNCRGSAAGSSRCQSLAEKIKELEESIAGVTRPRDGEKGKGAKSSAGSQHAELGGVDFRDLRLVYVKVRPDSHVTRSRAYSMPFRGGQYDTSKLPSRIGLSETSFQVGLVMPQQKFWVNLNPTEPDRVADAEFGRTEAARVLLESDLRMKKDAALITDPRSSAEAKDYWQRLRLAAGITGSTGEFHEQTRFWIVPGRIQMAGDGDEAYLVEAELKVELESEHAGSKGATDSTLLESRIALQRIEAIEKEFVLPRLQERVNNAVEYEELRQVFASLVMAVWQRQHVAIAVSDIPVDQRSLLSRPGWTPRTTWLDYCRSVEKGEYDFTEVTTETRGDLIVTRTVRYFDGGIDFTHIAIPPMVPMDADTRSALRNVATDGRPQRLGDRLLFSEYQLPGASNTGGVSQTSVPSLIVIGRSGPFVVVGSVVALGILLTLLTKRGIL